MTTVLNTDGFEEEIEHNYEPHCILYGKNGWTDEVDRATIDLLVMVGAVRLFKTVSGVGFETRIYVSIEGVGPR